MKKQLLCLMKIGQKEFMEKFLKEGSIYLQRWKTYKLLEDAERGDKNEGLSHSYQPHKVIININGTDLKQEDFAGPIRIENGADNPLIYCMYGFNTEHIKIDNGRLLNEKCYSFGDTAVVITNGQEFYNRIGKACEREQFGCEGKMIEYVDFNNYHGEIGCFRKFKKDFSHQHEFRFKFDTQRHDISYELKIGSIEDIAIICPINEVNNQLKIRSL